MRIRCSLLGVGAMNSPRFAPAGLLVRFARRAVAFDGGPAALPPGRIDAWLVCDERSELRTSLRTLAAERGLRPVMADFTAGGLNVRAEPVVHTSHDTCGYAIRAGDRLVVWAPEFLEFPAWAAGADLMFAEAAGWNRPIRFRGGVGGHASVLSVAQDAAAAGVRRLVFAHIGRPSIRAIDAGAQPPFGKWGVEGRTYAVGLP
ncbi:MBL fold metallo-hydrolase [Allorhizocola rhizosphaerae]|uniref:MBL fold metallo-hydrolase n=1 Tax=Allorhizocola rhizosphaerae TaxID=1872709 RepID=UPI001B8B0D32|nr:MBL fold metallo-hydrolase [Allorhizocola rhizosphaerae]